MVIKRYLFKCHRVHLSPSYPGPKLLFKGKYKCSLCYRHFVRACVWVLQKKQVKESGVVHPHLSHIEDGWNLFGVVTSRGRWTCMSPSCKAHVRQESPLQTPLVLPGPKPNTQETTVRCLSKLTSVTDDRKEMWLQEQRADIIFHFIINCTGYCIFVQIKMSQTSVSFVCSSSIAVKPNVSHSVINTSLHK